MVEVTITDSEKEKTRLELEPCELTVAVCISSADKDKVCNYDTAVVGEDADPNVSVRALAGGVVKALMIFAGKPREGRSRILAEFMDAFLAEAVDAVGEEALDKAMDMLDKEEGGDEQWET